MLALVKYDEQNSRVSDSNMISDPFQRGWAKIRIRSVSPQWLWGCQSSGYRQLCSLWFEYDLCLNRNPPSDHKSCLMTLIRIRSMSVPKGVKLWFKYDQRNLPMSSALCQSNGYRKLCSLWFEYDPCLNRKPPNDLKLFNDADSNTIHVDSQRGWAMIRIWSRSPQVGSIVC